jgi:hypothetical protein
MTATPNPGRKKRVKMPAKNRQRLKKMMPHPNKRRNRTKTTATCQSMSPSAIAGPHPTSVPPSTVWRAQPEVG